jgi:hypothetical protein
MNALLTGILPLENVGALRDNLSNVIITVGEDLKVMVPRLPMPAPPMNMGPGVPGMMVMNMGPMGMMPQGMPMQLPNGVPPPVDRSDEENQIYRKKKRKLDAQGKLIKLKDVGKKRRLAPRCSTISACIEQVRKFRANCMEKNLSLTNLNSTYGISSSVRLCDRSQCDACSVSLLMIQSFIHDLSVQRYYSQDGQSFVMK